MRYRMSWFELIGWMILGGFGGGALCTLTCVALAPYLPKSPLGIEYLLIFYLSVLLGVAVPIVIYWRGKSAS